MPIREPHRILRAISAHPWAILESKAQEILDVLDLRVQGGERTEAEIEAIVRSRRDTVVSGGNGVAVLPVFGVIAPRMDSMTAMSGGTSVEKLSTRFDELMANDDVGTIVLHVDSPGGNAQAVPEFAQKMFEARGKKRVIAVADGLMASAAYWIGSAADEIVVTPSGMVGSIGVFMIHTEVSRAEDEAGITRSIMRAGRFKAEANFHEPLSEDARAHIQETVDDYYDLFVEAVARQRGVSEAAVRDGMGEGRTLTAERAVSEGLADRVATLEDVLAELGIKPATMSSHASTPEELPATATADAAEGYPVDLSMGSPATGTIRIGPTAEHERPVQILTPTETDEDEAAPDRAEAEQDPITPEANTPSGEERTMPTQTDGNGPQNGAEKNGDGVTLTTLEAVFDHEAEAKRADEIIGLCKEHGIPNRITEFANSRMSTEQIRETIRLEAEQNLEAMTATQVEFSEAEAKRYSLCRAIMGVAEKGDSWSGFEREVSDEIRSKLPKNHDDHGGIFVPVRRNALGSDLVPRRHAAVARMQAMVRSQSMPVVTQARLLSQLDQMQAALDSGTATAGQELLFTDAGDFIDLLRARMKVAEMGATILTGLKGNVAFPKQDGAGTFSWVAEDPGSDLADSDLTLTQVALNAATGMSTTAYSRQLLNQGVVDVDNLVKNDLALITALGIDAAGINGSGASNEPEGVLNVTGIGDVDIGANGGAPTYEHIVDLETDVATANADIGAMAYLTTPGVRGKLKKTEEFSSSNGRPVWTGGMEGEVNGYPGHVSTQVPSDLTDGTGTNLHAVIFGVWSQLIIGYWGAYELVVDPYSLKKQALIELTSYQQAGVAVRHPASFSAIQDADPSA